MVLRYIVSTFISCVLLSNFPAYAREKGHLKKDKSRFVVKTIKTEYGDIYDCIDFFHQPAFNHPLLENHDFTPEMTPSSRPPSVLNNSKLGANNAISTDMLRFKDGGCPKGSVPVRRADIHYQPRYPTHPVSGTVFAIGQTKSDPSKNYKGVQGIFSVWNPQVGPNQYSSAEMILRGGTDTIVAGWTVDPIKFPDNKTRLFIYASAGNMHCYNSECGFVITTTEIPLGVPLKFMSTIAGTIYDITIFVYKDKMNGNWWLELNPGNHVVGFWPANIFQGGMENVAQYAACGGEVYTKDQVEPINAPVMGAGPYPDLDPNQENFAFCKRFAVLDQNNNFVDPDVEVYTNNPEYNAVDTHQSGDHIVYFGGPWPVNS